MFRHAREELFFDGSAHDNALFEDQGELHSAFDVTAEDANFLKRTRDGTWSIFKGPSRHESSRSDFSETTDTSGDRYLNTMPIRWSLDNTSPHSRTTRTSTAGTFQSQISSHVSKTGSSATRGSSKTASDIVDMIRKRRQLMRRGQSTGTTGSSCRVSTISQGTSRLSSVNFPWRKKLTGATHQELMTSGFFHIDPESAEKRKRAHQPPALAVDLPVMRMTGTHRPISVVSTPTSFYMREPFYENRLKRKSVRLASKRNTWRLSQDFQRELQLAGEENHHGGVDGHKTRNNFDSQQHDERPEPTRPDSQTLGANRLSTTHDKIPHGQAMEQSDEAAPERISLAACKKSPVPAVVPFTGTRTSKEVSVKPGWTQSHEIALPLINEEEEREDESFRVPSDSAEQQKDVTRLGCYTNSASHATQIGSILLEASRAPGNSLNGDGILEKSLLYSDQDFISHDRESLPSVEGYEIVVCKSPVEKQINRVCTGVICPTASPVSARPLQASQQANAFNAIGCRQGRTWQQPVYLHGPIWVQDPNQIIRHNLDVRKGSIMGYWDWHEDIKLEVQHRLDLNSLLDEFAASLPPTHGHKDDKYGGVFAQAHRAPVMDADLAWSIAETVQIGDGTTEEATQPPQQQPSVGEPSPALKSISGPPKVRQDIVQGLSNRSIPAEEAGPTAVRRGQAHKRHSVRKVQPVAVRSPSIASLILRRTVF